MIRSSSGHCLSKLSFGTRCLHVRNSMNLAWVFIKARFEELSIVLFTWHSVSTLARHCTKRPGFKPPFAQLHLQAPGGKYLKANLVPTCLRCSNPTRCMQWCRPLDYLPLLTPPLHLRCIRNQDNVPWRLLHVRVCSLL